MEQVRVLKTVEDWDVEFKDQAKRWWGWKTIRKYRAYDKKTSDRCSNKAIKIYRKLIQTL